MAIVPRSEEGENDSEEDNEGFTYDEDYVFRDEEDKEKS
jgi:hypothetical protein